MQNVYSQPDEAVSSLDPAVEAQLRSGANWFYWIAGLSLVNSAIFAFGGQISFIAGLGLTQVIDAIFTVAVEEGAPSQIIAVAVVIDVMVAAVFALFGYYANKGFGWVFILGIALYLLDALVYLAVGSVLAAAFHAFVLYRLVIGFMASRQLKQFAAENLSVGAA
jgi:hypothetical protein